MAEPSEEALQKNLIQFYDSLAPIYDLKYRNPSIEYMKQVEWSVISRYTKGRRLRLLDLGCGTGSLAARLANLGNEVVGVDISPDMISIARLKAEDAGVESRTQFHAANIEDLPPMLGAFDFAYSTFGAFNHVKNLTRALQGLNHVLSARGWLFFSLANRLGLRHAQAKSHGARTVWKKLEMKEVGKSVWTRFFDRNEVEDALSDSGFRLIDSGGVFYLVRPSYIHSDSEAFGIMQSLVARTESLMRWHSPANRRAAYLLFVARKVSTNE